MLQNDNAVEMAGWVFYKAMDPTPHCQDEGETPMTDLVGGAADPMRIQRPKVRVCTEASVHNSKRTPMQIRRHQHRNRIKVVNVDCEHREGCAN